MQLRQFPRYVICDVVVRVVQRIVNKLFYAHTNTIASFLSGARQDHSLRAKKFQRTLSLMILRTFPDF
jgi:hypothetical protein